MMLQDICQGPRQQERYPGSQKNHSVLGNQMVLKLNLSVVHMKCQGLLAQATARKVSQTRRQKRGKWQAAQTLTIRANGFANINDARLLPNTQLQLLPIRCNYCKQKHSLLLELERCSRAKKSKTEKPYQLPIHSDKHDGSMTEVTMFLDLLQGGVEGLVKRLLQQLLFTDD